MHGSWHIHTSHVTYERDFLTPYTPVPAGAPHCSHTHKHSSRHTHKHSPPLSNILHTCASSRSSPSSSPSHKHSPPLSNSPSSHTTPPRVEGVEEGEEGGREGRKGGGRGGYFSHDSAGES